MALLSGPLQRVRLFAAAALVASGHAALAAENSAPPLEDAVKAAYIYKFAPFVTWPAGAGAAAFDICSIGADGVTALLPQVTQGQRIDDKAIRVRALAEAEAPTGCQILYVAGPVPAGPVLDSVRGKPVLTVTSAAGAHGIVQLVTVERHVRFDIDAKLASEGGLSISSKLLSLARQVTPP